MSPRPSSNRMGPFLSSNQLYRDSCLNIVTCSRHLQYTHYYSLLRNELSSRLRSHFSILSKFLTSTFLILSTFVMVFLRLFPCMILISVFSRSHLTITPRTSSPVLSQDSVRTCWLC